MGFISPIAASDVEERVSRALRLLDGEERAFARDFMLSFDRDAPSDIAGLSNAVTFSLGDCVKCSVVGALPLQAPCSSAGFAIIGGWIPVFRSNGLVIGISMEFTHGIEGCKPIPGMPSPGQSGSHSVGRFVRDERSGEFLVLSTSYTPGHEPDGTMTLLHSEYVSDRERKQTFLRSDPNASDTNLSVGNVEAQMSRNLSRNAVVLNITSQKRSCPKCNSVNCGCGPSFVHGDGVPAKTMDFRSFPGSSARYAGEYIGMTSFFWRIAPGCEFHNIVAPLSSLVGSISGKDVHDTLSRLREASIQNRMIIGLQGNVPKGVGMLPGEMPLTALEKCELMGIFGEGQMNAGFPHESDDSIFGAANDEHVPHPVDGNALQEQVQVGRESSVNSATLVAIREASCGDMRPVEDVLTPVESQEASAGQHDDGQMTEVGGENEEVPANGYPPAEVDCRIETECGKKRSARSRGRPDSVLTAYELGRRKRNREAASRCNERKRLYRAELEKDLTDIQSRKEELMKLKKELEDENMELKGLAAKMWISQLKGSKSSR